MRLISEERGTRIYEIDGNTRYESRIYLQAFSFDILQPIAFDEAREQFEKISIELHTKWLAERNVETFGEISTEWTDVEITWHEGLMVDGEPVEYFEPFTLKRFTTEQGCWPPAPEDAP